MSSTEQVRKERKTNIMGISKCHEDTTIADVAKHFDSVELCEVRRSFHKAYNSPSFLLRFSSPEACENAREKNMKVTIKGVTLEPYFAPSNALAAAKAVVSEDKLYCRYPSTVSFDSVKAKLKGLDVSESGNDGSFCFIHCKDQKEQLAVKEKYDGMEIEGKPLSVTFAINKVRKNKPRRN